MSKAVSRKNYWNWNEGDLVVKVGKADHVYATEEDPKAWYGFDLDATLAHHVPTSGKFDETKIGDPVPADSPVMLRLRQLLKEGKDVRIFTARIADDPDGEIEQIIQAW